MTLALLILALRLRVALPPEPHRVPRLEVNEDATREFHHCRSMRSGYRNRTLTRQFFRP